MPPAKRTTKKISTKKAASRKPMSAAHKKALAEGRQMSATVDSYLRAINAPRPRGRQVSTESLRKRLADAQGRVRSGSGVDRVLAAQKVRDLRARLDVPSGSSPDVKALESAFVKVAKRFSASRGITYGAWRDAGVSAAVLRRAGVVRTHG